MVAIALTTAGKLRVVRSESQFTGVAAEAITIGQAVRIDTVTGKVTKSNGTGAAEARTLGIALKAAQAGEALSVLRKGILDGFALGALDYDAAVYLSDTDGAIADAAGTVSLAVGRVIAGFATTIGTAADKLLMVEFAAATVTAANGADVGLTGNANVIGGIPVLHRVDLASGVNADTDVVLTHKTRVIDAWLVLRAAGVAACVFTVKNGATAVTDGMAASGADKALVRAASIDDAQHEIAAGGILRVTGSGGVSQPLATMYVLGLRVA